MNEGDIKREIQRAWEWQLDEAHALLNAALWLSQAANNETPHGGIQSCPTSAQAAEQPSKSTMTLPSPSEAMMSITPTAIETEANPASAPSSSSGTENSHDLP